MAGLLDIVDEGVLGASNHVALALPLVVHTATQARASARDEALALVDFIARTRGAGAPIVANALRWLTAGVEALGPEDAARDLQKRAGEWDALSRARRSQLIEKAVAALDAVQSPLIFDYSSTVADVVRALYAKRQLTRIIIPESRAIDGGRRYLEALDDLEVAIQFLPDAALDYAVSKSDAVLLGAESISRDGGVLNTVGSVLSARSANVRCIPVYGVADLFKVGPVSAAEMRAQALREFDFILPDGVTAKTDAPELEIVTPNLIEAILTEEGAMRPEDIAVASAAAWMAADLHD